MLPLATPVEVSTMQSNPKVSIGMPVCNGEKFIHEALDALLAQTFTDFELNISDNASTDMTESICRAYAEKDSRIKYVRQTENIGPVANFQYVLDVATGEYFMWAAADDVWDANWIEVLLPIAANNQCLACGVIQSIDATGKNNRHPANGRKLEFCGYPVIRRMKFYLEPGVLGKGNLIYGIMPTEMLKEIGVSWIASEPRGAATVYLYVILARMEIRSSPKVRFYKRNHEECLGEISQAATKNNYIKRVLQGVKAMILQPIPGQYMRKSNAFEKPLILLLFVIAVIRVFYIAIVCKIDIGNRMAAMVNTK